MPDAPDPSHTGESAVERALDRAVASYAGIPVGRFLVQLVPMIGSAIDAYFGTWGQNIREDRLVALIDGLSEAVRSVGEDKLDRSFLETEEFYDLLTRAGRAAMETRDREKIRMYAALLIGAAVHPAATTPLEPEAALVSLISLTPTEVSLLRVIIDKTAGGASWPPNPEDVPAELVLDHDFHCKHIEAAGLIVEQPVYDRGQAGGSYVPTATLGRLVELLQAGGLVDEEPEGLEMRPATSGNVCALCDAEASQHFIASRTLIPVPAPGGGVQYVEMSGRVGVCDRCFQEVTGGTRHLAACPTCRSWGPDGGRCRECGGVLLSVLDWRAG
jgi:hypothetical protein